MTTQTTHGRASPARPFLDRVRHHKPKRVVRLLGLAEGPRGRSFACPVCGAERRGSGDKRFAAGYSSEGRRWSCYRCNAHGDAADLVAAIEGCEPGSPQARERWASLGLLSEEQQHGRSEGRSPRRRSAPDEPPPKGPRYPPGAGEHWRQGTKPVTTSNTVSGYLEGRGIDPAVVARLNLARAPGPPQAPIPPWLPTPAGWPLLFARYDAAGSIVSLQGRRVEGVGPKTCAPKGNSYSTSGTVFACPRGVALLQSGRWPDGAARAVLVVEGEIDLVTMACHYASDADRPAVLAITQGAWTRDLARRIPVGSVVLLGTDAGPEGDRYAAEIKATLGRRHAVHRVTPTHPDGFNHDGTDATDIGATRMAELVSLALQSNFHAPSPAFATSADESPAMNAPETNNIGNRGPTNETTVSVALELDSEALQNDRNSHPYQTTGHGLPYVVVPPGGGKLWFVANPRGGFDPVPSALLSRTLGDEWPQINVWVPSKKDGEPRRMSGPDLFEQYGAFANKLIYTYSREAQWTPGHGRRGTVHHGVFTGPAARPLKHDKVLEFFAVLFGSKLETMLDWLATAHRFDRPTAVPVLIGQDSDGKSMIAQGLAAAFGGVPTNYDTIFRNQFTDSLLRSPIVWLDEETEIKATAAGFKKLTGNTSHTIEGKGTPAGTLEGCPRLIVTSNEENPLAFGGKLSSLRGERAIGIRILTIQCQSEAAEWLIEHGRWTLTPDWVKRSDKTPGKIAETIAWLAETRTVEIGRFCVEGSRDEWLDQVASRDGLPATVLEALRAHADLSSRDRAGLGAEPILYDSKYPEHAIVYPGELHKCWTALHSEQAPSIKKLGVAMCLLSRQKGSKKLPLSSDAPGARGRRGHLIARSLLQGDDK